MRLIFIIAFCLNIFFVGGFKYMIGMIRSLQLILHLPIMTVIFPSNVMMFFNIVIPIVMFDIFENEQGIGP